MCLSTSTRRGLVTSREGSIKVSWAWLLQWLAPRNLGIVVLPHGVSFWCRGLPLFALFLVVAMPNYLMAIVLLVAGGLKILYPEPLRMAIHVLPAAWAPLFGVAEIVLASSLVFKRSRSFARTGVFVILLIGFANIIMANGSCGCTGSFVMSRVHMSVMISFMFLMLSVSVSSDRNDAPVRNP